MTNRIASVPQEIMRTMGRFAADPDLNFDVDNADDLSRKIRKLGKVT